MDAPALRPERDETSVRYPGWRVVGVCFLLATFSWALGFYGQGVYLAELTRIHGWPSSLIAMATTCFYLFSALLIAFVGDLGRRFGARALMLGGIACLGVSTILLGRVRSPVELYAVYALMAFGWAGTSIAAITTTIGTWFSERRGMAISFALNGASCGGVIGVPLLVFAIGVVGFAPALVMTVALMMLVLVPAVLWGIGRTPPVHVAAANVSTAPAARRAQAFGDRHFLTVTIAFALALFAQVGLIVHQISYLQPMIGREKAALAVAIMTAMAVIGRILVGTVIDRLDQRLVSAASFVSQACAVAAMLLIPHEVVLLTAAAIFGFSVGNNITLPSLIIQREFSPRSFPTLVSLLTAVTQFTYALSPGLIGVVRDLSGSYAVALSSCILCQLVAAVVVMARPAQPSPL
jgi:MFS family permease